MHSPILHVLCQVLGGVSFCTGASRVCSEQGLTVQDRSAPGPDGPQRFSGICFGCILSQNHMMLFFRFFWLRTAGAVANGSVLLVFLLCQFIANSCVWHFQATSCISYCFILFHVAWADPRYQQDPSLQSSENLVDALPPSQLPSWIDVPCVSPNCANEEGCDCISGCTCRSWTTSGSSNFYGLMATLSMQPNWDKACGEVLVDGP